MGSGKQGSLKKCDPVLHRTAFLLGGAGEACSKILPKRSSYYEWWQTPALRFASDAFLIGDLTKIGQSWTWSRNKNRRGFKKKLHYIVKSKKGKK